MKSISISLVFILAAAIAPAQSPVEIVPGESLPSGTPVSQPLRPAVEELPTLPSVPERVEPIARNEQSPKPSALDRSWFSSDFLLYWAKGSRLPPLATVNSAGRLPTLDDPATRVVLGGKRLAASELGGGRFTWGWSRDDAQTVGFEASYFFMGTHSQTFAVSGGGTYGSALGRPLIDPLRGIENITFVSHPSMLGSLTTSLSERVQGWEALGLAHLGAVSNIRFHALAGYRYFMLNEGIRLEQEATFRWLDDGLSTLQRTSATDQVDAHNRFHGGLLGVRAIWDSGRFFARFDGKVSLGRTLQVTKISGQTVSVGENSAGTTTEYFQGAVFGQPSNAGRHERSAFGVLPEGTLQAGLRIGTSAKFFVGYNFLYLNDVIRAGDQLDRTVDLTQSLPGDPVALRMPSTRPMVAFDRSSYWLHGVTLGLEWRY